MKRSSEVSVIFLSEIYTCAKIPVNLTSLLEKRCSDLIIQNMMMCSICTTGDKSQCRVFNTVNDLKSWEWCVSVQVQLRWSTLPFFQATDWFWFVHKEGFFFPPKMISLLCSSAKNVSIPGVLNNITLFFQVNSYWTLHFQMMSHLLFLDHL